MSDPFDDPSAYSPMFNPAPGTDGRVDPQESSPGKPPANEMARIVNSIMFNGEGFDKEWHRKKLIDELTITHQKEIQAAKREGKQTGYRHVANYMDATPSDTSDEVKRAWAEVRKFLNMELKEEITNEQN